MNMAEYTKALSRLPLNYKTKPRHAVRECEWNGVLICAADLEEPIWFINGEWEEIPIGVAA